MRSQFTWRASWKNYTSKMDTEQLVTEKYNGKVSAKPNGDEVRVKKVYLRLVHSQDINRYTFPENMAGYSHAIQ